MHTEKPGANPAHAASLAAHRTEQKQDRQVEPLAPGGVFHRKCDKSDRASGAASRQTTERMVKLLDPDNIGRGQAKQGSVDLTSGIKSSLQDGRAAQAENPAKAGGTAAQHTHQTPVAADGDRHPAPAATPAPAGSVPRHSEPQTVPHTTHHAAARTNATPAPTEGGSHLHTAATPRADAPSAAIADSPTEQQTDKIASTPSETTPRMATAQPVQPAQPAQAMAPAQNGASERMPPSPAAPLALRSTDPAPLAPAAIGDTRAAPESATPADRSREQPIASAPLSARQAATLSLDKLLETLDKEWRQDISTLANDSAARSGANGQQGMQPEVVRQYAESITALLQSPPTPLTAHHGQPAAAVAAENARRESFDREVTERLKRVLAAGPNAASQLTQTDITAIHAESLRRELVDNGVLAPNEDLPDAGLLT